MITELYRDYFQKSHTFLYPFLRIKKHAAFRPEQTFVRWKSVHDPKDRLLMVMYPNIDTPEWKDFQRKVLLTNSLLSDVKTSVDGTKMIFIFDLNAHAEDYDHFLAGKYSLISDRSRKLISDYYGIHTPEWAYVESFVFPKKYFTLYANILNVEESLLKEVGELCEAPCPVRETLSVDVADLIVEDESIL